MSLQIVRQAQPDQLIPLVPTSAKPQAAPAGIAAGVTQQSGAGFAAATMSTAAMQRAKYLPPEEVIDRATALAVRLRAEPKIDVPGREVQIHVRGKANEIPAVPSDPPVLRKEILDCVIVGGGLAGMAAQEKLRGKRSLILEWGDNAGGLAAQKVLDDGRRVGIGAAYFTYPHGKVAKFYRDVGLGSPKERELEDPIDSYLASGMGKGQKPVFYRDMWHGDALASLPKEFAEFKTFLLSLDRAGMIGDIPLERESKIVKMWDGVTAAEIIKKFGPNLKSMLDLYCMSALGSTTDELSAMVFLNFYIDEIEKRLAFSGGTGGIAEHIEKRLRRRDPRGIETGVLVYEVKERSDGLVEVRFNKDGKNEAVLARAAIMATPLNITAKVVKGLPDERQDIIGSLQHCNYIVHTLYTPEPVFEESYDTWVKGHAFADVIVGRWVDEKGFADPASKGRGPGILSVYQPLPLSYRKNKLDDAEVKELAKKALASVDKLFPAMKRQSNVKIESNRWPASIHVTTPGYITQQVERLLPPVGNIFFASNNLGTPSWDEAIGRGIDAAQDVRKLLATQRSTRVAPLPEPKAAA